MIGRQQQTTKQPKKSQGDKGIIGVLFDISRPGGFRLTNGRTNVFCVSVLFWRSCVGDDREGSWCEVARSNNNKERWRGVRSRGNDFDVRLLVMGEVWQKVKEKREEIDVEKGGGGKSRTRLIMNLFAIPTAASDVEGKKFFPWPWREEGGLLLTVEFGQVGKTGFYLSVKSLSLHVCTSLRVDYSFIFIIIFYSVSLRRLLFFSASCFLLQFFPIFAFLPHSRGIR